MISYWWEIYQLECYSQSAEGNVNQVFCVHWRRKAKDNLGHEGDIYGSQIITLNAQDTFTPYSDLTRQQVEGWLETFMGADKVAELDAGLDRQIEAQINPPIIKPPLPWNAI